MTICIVKHRKNIHKVGVCQILLSYCECSTVSPSHGNFIPFGYPSATVISAFLSSNVRYVSLRLLPQN
ncbi:hypothetical protein KP509_13G005700 [Ceratopteris richardii]|uniref:Uncharacterized protein n=1 Tax=Ceratopteris richardii TaxID=49495 RepID=A0A8T2TEY6_CERRI|nr:hypothetical protein KP509_13G005700 [Ceratopteris richardii]